MIGKVHAHALNHIFEKTHQWMHAHALLEAFENTHNKVHAHALLLFRSNLHAALEPFINLTALFSRWSFQRRIIESGAFVVDLENFCRQVATLPSKALMIHVVKVIFVMLLSTNLQVDLKASITRARQRTKVAVYQPQEVELVCRHIVVAARNSVHSCFQLSPERLDRQKKIDFFSKPYDAMSSSQALMREIWRHWPDVNLPAFPVDDAARFVDNLVWPFALKYASQLRPIIKPFLDVQTYLISEAKDDENLKHLEQFSSTFQPNSLWLDCNCIINRFGIVSEVDGVSTYQDVFDSSSVQKWSDPAFRFDRILFCVDSLESCPIIAVNAAPDGTDFPWFFHAGLTWGEFRDRCQQCANVVVDVEGLCSFLWETRMSWIPLFDPIKRNLNPSVTLPVSEKSFVLAVPRPPQSQEAREEEGVEEEEGKGEAEGEEEGKGEGEGSRDGEGDGEGEGEGEGQDSEVREGEGNAGRKDEVGTKSGVSFSAMPDNSVMAEKASEGGAKSQHRLEDVFPKTVAGDSVVHAHTPH